MSRIRKLAPEEYPLLKNAGEDGFIPDARNSVALIAEENGAIIGRIFLLSPTHIEGPWIRDDFRGGTLLGRLVDAAEVAAKEAGIRKLMAYGATKETEDYLARLGFRRAPLTVWEKEI